MLGNPIAAAALEYDGSCAPPQCSSISQAVEDMLWELRTGYGQILTSENEAALEHAISDELGRGTDPAKLRKRLLVSMAEKEGPFYQAA